MAIKRPREEILRNQERRKRGPERAWHWVALNAIFALFLLIAVYILEQVIVG